MLDDNIKYANSLAQKYDIEVDISVLDGSETTILEIAQKVLPEDELIVWMKEQKEHTKQLRQEFDKKPYDKFDKQIDELLAELES